MLCAKTPEHETGPPFPFAYPVLPGRLSPPKPAQTTPTDTTSQVSPVSPRLQTPPVRRKIQGVLAQVFNANNVETSEKQK